MTNTARNKVFGFVGDYFDQHGFAPTLDEIGVHCGFSRVSAWKHVKALVAEGRLKSRPGTTRGLSIPGRVLSLASVPTTALEAELARRRRASPAICGECGLRPDEPAARACTRSDCPLAKLDIAA